MVLRAEPPHKPLAPIALWVVPVPDLGGVARHVLDVAGAGLPGWRLVVLCPEGPLAKRLRSLGGAVIAAPVGPEFGFIASVATLRSNIRRLRPHVVHSHLAYADVVAAAAVLGSATKLVTTEHGIAVNDTVYHGSPWKSQIKALMHRIRLRRADAVIAVSKATRDAMTVKWKPRQAVTVIPNGVDSESVRQQVTARRLIAERTGGGSAGLRVLSLSRLAPEKKLDVLLRAFASVCKSEPTAQLTIAGEGPERELLEGMAAQLGLTGSVHFVGFVDPLVAMAEADVLVQLSVWENCSYTLLDAVSAGMGVVATAVGGNLEILPSRCLVAANDVTGIACCISLQGARKDVRPVLPADWPSSASMAVRLAAEYAEVNRTLDMAP